MARRRQSNMPRKTPSPHPTPSTEQVLAAVSKLLSEMGVGGTPTAAQPQPPAPRGRGRTLTPLDERLLAEVVERGSATVAELAKGLSLPIAEVTASLRALAEGEHLTLVHEPQPSPGRGLRMRAYDQRNVALQREPSAGVRRTG
jgi:hypothetical protein